MFFPIELQTRCSICDIGASLLLHTRSLTADSITSLALHPIPSDVYSFSGPQVIHKFYIIIFYDLISMVKHQVNKPGGGTFKSLPRITRHVHFQKTMEHFCVENTITSSLENSK